MRTLPKAKGNMEVIKRGTAPVGTTEAEGVSEKVNAQIDDITPEGLQRLSLRVKRVEREYAELLETWLIPYARDCAISGRRFSVGERCDYLAWHGVKSCSHNDQPILARVLLQRMPEARGLVELRRCKVDAVFEARGSV